MGRKYTWASHLHSDHESLWSLVHKFQYLNVLSASELQKILPISLAYNSSMTNCVLNRNTWRDMNEIKIFKQIFELTDKQLSQFSPGFYTFNFGVYRNYFYCKHTSEDAGSLKFCLSCAAVGFHSTLFQLVRVKKCIIHDELLQEHCPECGNPIRIDYIRKYLSNPYGCICGYRISNLENISLPEIILQRKRNSEVISRYLNYKNVINKQFNEPFKKSKNGVRIFVPSQKYHPDYIDISFDDYSPIKWSGKKPQYEIDLKRYRKSNTQLHKNEDSSYNVPSIEQTVKGTIKSYGHYIKLLSQNPTRLEAARDGNKLKGLHKGMVGDTPFTAIEFKQLSYYWNRYWFKRNRRYNGIKTSVATHLISNLQRKRQHIRETICSNVDCRKLDLERLLNTIIEQWFYLAFDGPIEHLMWVVEMQRQYGDRDIFKRTTNKHDKRFYIGFRSVSNLFIHFDDRQNVVNVAYYR